MSYPTLTPATTVQTASTTTPAAVVESIASATPSKDIDLSVDNDATMTREQDTTVSDDPSFLDTDLTLCRLCVGEHEFGVAFEEDSDTDSRPAGRGGGGADATAQKPTDARDATEDAAWPTDACALLINGAAHVASSTSPSSQQTSTTAVRGVFDFDVTAYVHHKIRAGVALDTLAADLDVFIPHMQDKMQQHVHTDLYNAFINVSSHLVGVQDELQCLQRPLSNALAHVGTLRDRLRVKADMVQTKLSHAEEAELERVFALTMIRVVLVYDAVMHALQRIADACPLLRLRPLCAESTHLHADATAPSSSSPSPGGAHNVVDSPTHGRHATTINHRAGESSCPAARGGPLRSLSVNTAVSHTSPNRMSNQEKEEEKTDCVNGAVAAMSATQIQSALQQWQSVLTSLEQLDFLVDSLPRSWRERRAEELRAAHDRRAVARSTALDMLNTLLGAVLAREGVQRGAAHLVTKEGDAPAAAVWSTRTSPTEAWLLRTVVALYVRADARSALVATLRQAVVQPVLDEAVARAADEAAVTRASASLSRRLYTLHDAVQERLLPLLVRIRSYAESSRDDTAVNHDDGGMGGGDADSSTTAAAARRTPLLRIAEDVLWPCVMRALDGDARRGGASSATHSPPPHASSSGDGHVPSVSPQHVPRHDALPVHSRTSRSSADEGGDGASRAMRRLDLRSTDVFPRSYRAAFTLTGLVDRSCLTRQEWQRWRMSPAMTSWQQRWDTDIYAAMRVGVMERAVEEALQTHQTTTTTAAAVVVSAEGVGTENNRNNSNHTFALAPWGVLVTHIRHLFSPEVMLPVCLPVFIRRTVQLCVRTGDALAQNSGVTHISSFSVTASPSRPSAGAEEEAGAVAGWMVFIADVHRFDDFIQEEWADAVVRGAEGWSAMGWQSAEWGATSLQAMLRPIQAHLHRRVATPLLTRAEERVVGEVMRISAVALQNIKSIRSAYTRTNKPLPHAPSWYVGHVAEPILRLVRQARASAVPVTVTQRVAVAAMSAVTQQFVTLARGMLLAARRMEASWEKLRRRKETNTATTSSATSSSPPPPPSSSSSVGAPRVTSETASDRDKMMLQIYRDINAFLSTVTKELGVWASPSREVQQQVDDLLRRAEWLLGAAMAEPPEIEDVAPM